MSSPPLSEVTETTATPRRGLRRMVAVLAATVLVAGTIAYVIGRAGHGDSALPKLALSSTGGAGTAESNQDATARSSLALNVSYHYVVDGTLPGLAPRARVFKLVDSGVDAGSVRRWAEVLKIAGDAEPVDQGDARGWTVSGPSGLLNVGQNAGTWYFNYQAGDFTQGANGAGAAPGAVTGSDSGPISSPPSLSDSVTTDGAPSPVAEPTRPQDLSSAADARRLGEQTLRELGVVNGDWEFEVGDGGAVGVASACAPGVKCDPFPAETYTVSRMLTAHRLVDGHRIAGLEWTVDIGDHSVINNVSGTIAAVEPIGDYPLRATSAAIDDLRNGRGYGGPIPLGAPEARSTTAIPACGPAVDCVEPTPICPETCPAQEVTITITGVSLGAQLWNGIDSANPVAYVVPTYHLTGHDQSGADWSADLLALTDDVLTTPASSTPTSSAVPSPPGPTGPSTTVPAPEPNSEPPSGPKVAIGDSVPMTFNLNFHCGVSEARFNAQWWDATPPWPGSGGASPHIDDLDGRLSLDDADHAHWTNGSGVRLEFIPHVGPHSTHGCD